MKSGRFCADAGRGMKYIGSALRYMFKNFIFVFLFALIPSYFFAMTVDTDNARVLTQELISADGGVTFSGLFTFFSPVNAGGWPYALVCLAALAVSLPFLFGFIEKHMRIGSRSFKGLAGRFNTNFITTLVLTLLGTAVYELWALLAAGLIFAESLILTGIAYAAVAIATYAAMVALVCYLLSAFLTWLPCLLVTGYRFFDALDYSNQICTGHKGGLFLACFLPAAAGLVLEVAAVALSGFTKLPLFLITELLFLFFMLYYASLMFVAYFRLTGEERMDLKKKFG